MVVVCFCGFAQQSESVPQGRRGAPFVKACRDRSQIATEALMNMSKFLLFFDAIIQSFLVSVANYIFVIIVQYFKY